MILVAGLRHQELGNSDNIALYIPAFQKIQYLTFRQVFLAFKDTDPFFYLLMKLFTVFSKNLNLYIFFLSLFTIIPYGYLIYKKSKNTCISFLIYIALNFYFLSFITYRHSLASAILVLAYIAFGENKIKKFVILTLIASLFHSSAIVFLLLLFIRKIKFNYKWIIYISLSLIVSIFFSSVFKELIFKFVTNSHYLLYKNINNTINLNAFYINLMFIIFCLVFNKKINEDDKINLNLICFGTCISSMTIIIDVFYRIALFFVMPIIIEVPTAISKIAKAKDRMMVSIILSLLLIIYTFISTLTNLNLIDYKFFWN